MYHSSRLFLITAIVIVINILSSMFFWRIDLTQSQIYTFSPATSKIVSTLPDNIEIIAFISQDLPPQFVNSKNQLQDKLKEYDRLSSGKIKISYLDPIGNTESEKLAQSFGIPPLDLQVVQNDQVQIKKAYFGLAIVKNKTEKNDASSQNPLDKFEKYDSIPVVENISSFEYDIATKLLKVGSVKLPAIGFLTGHNEHSLMPASQYAGMNSSDPRMDYPIRAELEDNYEIKTIDLAAYISSTEEKKTNPLSEINTLIIAGPQEAIPDDQAKLINEYIDQGGNAVMLIDQFNINTQYGLIATSITENFKNLLSPLGVSVESKIIADNTSDMATFNQGFVSYSIPYPFFTKVSALNRTNSITQDLESVTFPWASPVNYDKTDKSISALALSSEIYTLFEEQETTEPAVPKEGESFDAPKENIKLQPISLDPEQDFGFNSQKKDPVALAVMVERENKGKVVVTGDSDFVVQGGSNTTFFLNIVDSLSLGNDLIQIRSKGVTDRPLKNISDTEKNTIRWGLIIGVPLIFVLYGFYRRSVRNAMKKRI